MIDFNQQYTIANSILGDSDLDFMNHGYAPSLNIIDEEDFLFKNQITLYLQMFENINVSNKKILEVGCGRGGGASSIKKYLNPLEISACDFNLSNIKYCIDNQSSDIIFKHSDAQELLYPDKYFDIVINVESSHCYNNIDLFFTEVSRVLNDDGIFLYTDCGKNIHEFYRFFDHFKKISRYDITENVKLSCEEDSEKFDKMIYDEKIKNIYSNISKEKAKEYASRNNQYIKYVAHKG